SIEDLRVLEGDATRPADVLFVTTIANPAWFSLVNAGSFVITEVGTSSDYKPFVRINNEAGVQELNRQMSVDENGITITESDDNRFDSIREVAHVSIDEFNNKRRIVYLTPADRSYK